MKTRRQFVREGTWAAMAGVPALPLAAEAQDRPAGPPVSDALSASVLSVLMASAEAITGVRPLRGHYEAYYRYQATWRPAHREVYRRFAEVVTAAAGEVGLADFAAADLSARAGILGNLRARPEMARAFEIPIFRETLAVFARTDAWLALGYTSWEGSARGLDEYRRPIAGTLTAPR